MVILSYWFSSGRGVKLIKKELNCTWQIPVILLNTLLEDMQNHRADESIARAYTEEKLLHASILGFAGKHGILVWQDVILDYSFAINTDFI